jgi:hypothetical protein
MRLLIAEPADPIAGHLDRVLRSAGREVAWLDEGELFTAPFWFRREGTEVGGAVRVGGRDVALGELRGVLLRPRRRWWPSESFDLKDQMFVYHETTASWFALLESLDCPVVNRFQLGWWLHDPGCVRELRRSLAAELALACASFEAGVEQGALVPVPVDPAQAISVYLAGRRIVPRSEEGEEAARELERRREALDRWQRHHGVELCRLDFERAGGRRLRHVEAMPPLDGEDPTLLGRLGQGLEEVLS